MLLAFASSAGAEVPSGPRLLFTRLTTQPKNFAHPERGTLHRSDVISSDPLGGDRLRVIHAHSAIGGTAWSPDGAALAVVKGASLDVFLARADGSQARRLTRLGAVTSPVFSADGQAIYFARSNPDIETRKLTYFSFPDTSIWHVGATGGQPVNLTEPSNTIADVPGSVSPTTGDLAVTHYDCRRQPCTPTIMLIDPATGVMSLVVTQGADPAISPDGLRLAFVSYRDRNWPKDKHVVYAIPELYVLDLTTGALHRMTATRHVFEATPSWDPSGQRIAFATSSKRRTALFEINADGTCKTQIASEFIKKKAKRFGALGQPAWQPGPGRGAGPIAC